MAKIINKVKNFLQWVWNECKDWHTIIVLIIVCIIMYSPAWVGFIMFALFKWEWCAAVASAYVLFWAGPFTPFFPLCIGITLSIKKITNNHKNKQ